MSDRRILITGASGFLGWNLCRAAKESAIVFGTTHSHPGVMDGVDLAAVDLTEPRNVAELLERIRPDLVIHAAALSQPNDCEAHPEDSLAITVDATAILGTLCADRAIRMVYTSTDMVFDGTASPYDENAPTTPLSTYGKHKAMAEERLLAMDANHLICRLPLMFGHPGPYAQSFLQPWLASLRNGRRLTLFTDEWRTPVSGRVAARGILLAAATSHAGLLNLGGPERISRYDFGMLAAEVFDVSNAAIVAMRQRDVTMAAPRPSDVSLDSSRANAMGYQPPPLRKQLEELRDVA